MPRKVSPEVRAEREALILQRRSESVPFRKIAEEIGLSHAQVRNIYTAAVDRLPAERVSDLRREQGEILDHVIYKMLGVLDAERGPDGRPITPRSMTEAAQAIVKALERKGRLFGLDAPTRKEVTVVTDEVLDETLQGYSLERAELMAKIEAAKRFQIENTITAEIVED